jgi:hypothetical protein
MRNNGRNISRMDNRNNYCLMLIEGKKNLELVQRALHSHAIHCTEEFLKSDEKEASERWDPEIKATEELINAVYINLKQYNETE